MHIDHHVVLNCACVGGRGCHHFSAHLEVGGVPLVSAITRECPVTLHLVAGVSHSKG